MLAAYFDSSALVKLVIDEAGRDRALRLWNTADLVLTSRLAYPEVRGALASAHRNHRYDAERLRALVGHWNQLWANVRPLALSPATAARAGDLAEVHGLSGADAVHLATAESAGIPDLIVATWDRRLAAAARDAGLQALPDTVA